ncbi:MAG: hypothetical protein NTX15_05160 [Candidatus Kapabacteria bacterium]|nr:hypothetical protein [Candidatus Kapabacteria bacterium]
MPDVRVLGPFPPPFGGVALHCVRLLEMLGRHGVDAHGSSLGGIPSGLQDIRKWKPWQELRRVPTHYHTDEGNHRWARMLGSIWNVRKTPYIVSVHSFRERQEFVDRHVREELSNVYGRARVIIAISDEVADSVSSTLRIPRSRITTIASNLPISQWEQNAVLHEDIAREWKRAPVKLLANAGRLVSYRGEDLYGLDVLVRAFRAIDDPSIALCLVLGHVVNADIDANLRSLYEGDNRITIIRGLQSPILPLVKVADIVIRPTRTEGGPSLTLSEALELGTWAIGSDCVPRPEGCILFQSGNHLNLSQILREAIEQVQSGAIPMVLPNLSDTYQAVLKAYQIAEFLK